MRVPRIALLAAALVAAGALAAPAAEALDAPSVYIQRYEFETDYPREKQLVNLEIDHLKALFKALSTVDDRDEAVYAIQSTRFKPYDDEVEFSAEFVVRDDSARPKLTHQAGFGRGPEPGLRVSTALNDYLDKTLFNPQVGPYPQIAIESCNDRDDRLVLTTRWTDKLETFEHKFTFEIGRYDATFDEYTGTGVFLKIVKWKVARSEAVLEAGNLVRTDGSPVGETCSDTGLGHDLRKEPRYLLMRIYTPEPQGAEGDGHGAYVGP